MTGSSKRSSLLRVAAAPARAVSHASWFYPLKVQIQRHHGWLRDLLTLYSRVSTISVLIHSYGPSYVPAFSLVPSYRSSS